MNSFEEEFKMLPSEMQLAIAQGFADGSVRYWEEDEARVFSGVSAVQFSRYEDELEGPGKGDNPAGDDEEFR